MMVLVLLLVLRFRRGRGSSVSRPYMFLPGIFAFLHSCILAFFFLCLETHISRVDLDSSLIYQNQMMSF